MQVELGDRIPEWTMEHVAPERMRTIAAILRDPNPIHWDPAEVEARGGGYRVINQSPINVGYIANMLMHWAGPASIRRLRVEFPGAVFGGDQVTACGRVSGIDPGPPTLVECEVWLENQEGAQVVAGTAVIELS